MANDSKTKTSFHLIQLKLTNFRCFSELSIDLHPDLTVLVAPNSGGKTAILDAIAIAMNPFFRGIGNIPFFKGAAYKLFSLCTYDIRMMPIVKNGAVISMEQALNASISVLGKTAFSNSNRDDNRPVWWNIEKLFHESISYKNHPLYLYAQKKILPICVDSDYQLYDQTSHSVIPLIAYYGTGRLWDQKKLTAGKQAKTDHSRLSGYTDAIVPSSRFKHFKDWFMHITYSIIQQKDQPDRNKNFIHICFIKEAVVKAVDKVLEGTGWHELDYDVQKEDVTLKHDLRGELTVSQMSDGFRVVIGLVADIAFRCVKLNPNLGPYACENTDGLVLIDEIDLHLHPEWQQRILISLQKAFPRIQFIVTTHSPQVLTTIKAENIRKLIIDEKGTGYSETPSFNTYAEESRVTLEDVFNTNSRPPLEIANSLKEYQALVELGDYDSDKALKLRENLEKVYGSNHVELQMTDMDIRRKKAIKKAGNK